MLLLLGALLMACSPLPAAPAEAVAEAPASGERLSKRIDDLYDADQKLLENLAKANEDLQFRQTYVRLREQVETEQCLANFSAPAIYAKWASDPAAPPIVRRYVAFRKTTADDIRRMVSESGWPQRRRVGDRGAAEFFFLFGHADDINAWRLRQVATLERVFHEDRVNPRLYAHLRDRLADVAGQPQIFGTIMGPDKLPHTAKLYWPLDTDEATTDARRRAIGLPTIEQDLKDFRDGAEIGPYMTPQKKGASWTLADVYVHQPGRTRRRDATDLR